MTEHRLQELEAAARHHPQMVCRELFAEVRAMRRQVEELRRDLASSQAALAELLRENAVLRAALEACRPGNPENGELR